MPEQLPADVEALRDRAVAFVEDVLRPADAQLADGDAEAGARVRLKNMVAPPDLKEVSTDIEELDRKPE